MSNRVRKRASLWFLATLALCLTISASLAAGDPPEITAPVTDRADVVSSGVESRLGSTLRDHYRRTGVQLAVLTVPTTGGEPIEDFSIRTATQWGGGDAGQDRGVLLTLAVEDRRSRLEVGYGLEGVIPDRRAARILRDMRPQLSSGDYDGAVESAVATVVEATDHLEAGQRPGLMDAHPLWNGALGMLIMVFLGLALVGVPGVLIADEYVEIDHTLGIAGTSLGFLAGGGLVYWWSLGIAPLGYVSIYASGAAGGVILALAPGMRRFAPIPAIFLFLCLVAIVPEFNGGLPPDASGKMAFFAFSYACVAILPWVAKYDTQTVSRRRDEHDSGFSSGSSGGSSSGGYSGGGGSFGGGGASGGW